MMETQLTLNWGGFPPFSARGVHQTLTPLKSGEFRRTVNGELVFTGVRGHQKYTSRLTCVDQAGPALEGLWAGEAVEVGCATRLFQEMTGDGAAREVVLSRAPVAGSVSVATRLGEALPFQVEAQRITLQDAPILGEKVYLSYRPHLSMRVISFALETDEWGAQVGWRLDLEEI